MKNNINIYGNSHTFSYIIEHSKNALSYNDYGQAVNTTINYCVSNDAVKLHTKDIKYYRNKNEWYSVDEIYNYDSLTSESLKTSNIKIYIPLHSVATYVNNVKYAITLNTWINGVKIDLGSFIFGHTDTFAIPFGNIKQGNNEYYECIDFNIIDPFYLLYSDEFADFRQNICNEHDKTNYSVSELCVSLFVVDETNDKYILSNNWIGGTTSMSISNSQDYLSLSLNTNYNPLGFKFELSMNEVYDDLCEYLNETYNIDTHDEHIKYELVIKNKDSVIPVGQYMYNGTQEQIIHWAAISTTDTPIKKFFNDWNTFEEGWCLAGSLVIHENIDGEDTEIFSILSNELPITQEIFSIYTNGGAMQIIDINDMEIKQINVVNKIENKIVKLERPNESKSNIIQPVFFKVKDSEILTLHPVVSENICINLDDYKSKVKRFILQVDGHRFEQIGSNKYGILFKIPANVISGEVLNGTYYVLNEDFELVTSGKYTCVI